MYATTVGSTIIAGRNTAWSYDADGRLISRNELSPNGLTYAPLVYKYDAVGRLSQTTQTTSREVGIHNPTTQTTAVTQVETYDGDGAGVKHMVTKQVNSNQPSTASTYYLRSTILGGRTISEYNSSGVRQTSYAWGGANVLAQQTGADTSTPSLKWEHLNPVTGDGRETDASGIMTAATHLDPDGVDAGESDPFAEAAGDPSEGGAGESAIEGRVAALMSGYFDMKCSIDGLLTGCALATSAIESGAAAECPNDDCGPRRVVYQGQETWASFHAYADGYQGYVPSTASYVGDGRISPLSSGPPSFGGSNNSSLRNTDLVALNGGSYREEQDLGRTPEAAPQNPTLDDIIKQAKAILTSHPGCRGLFSDDTDPVDLLNKLASGDPAIGSITYGAMTSSSTGKPLNALAYTISTLGSKTVTKSDGTPGHVSTWAVSIVMSNTVSPTSTRFGLSTLNDRALTLIHELGHAANLLRNGPGDAHASASSILSDNDTDKAWVSVYNTQHVFNVCFSYLNSSTGN